MPLIIPKTLPAYDALYEENVFVMHRERAASQHIRPLEILILNLMPKAVTAYAVPPPPKWEALAKPQSLFFARGSPFGGAAERSEAERASPFAF